MDGMKAMLERCGYAVNDKEERKNSTYEKGNKYNRNTGKDKGQSKDPFWEKYLADENTYFSDQEKRKIDPNYVDLYAQTLARKFKQKGVKITQIRGFYNTVVKLNRKVNGNLKDSVDFDEVKPDLVMLKSYANNKFENGYVSKDFVSYIEKNVNRVHDKKDLKAFKTHFEAIIGYMPKDR